MDVNFGSRLKHAWNAFRSNAPNGYLGGSYSHRPDRMRFHRGNERTIVTAIYNRIALDVAATDIKHVKLDEDGRYLKTLDTGLNYCLTTEANIDQTSRAFILMKKFSLVGFRLLRFMTEKKQGAYPLPNWFGLRRKTMVHIISCFVKFLKIGLTP